MKFYFDGDLSLSIPKRCVISQSTISENTPHHLFVVSKRKDIEKEMGNLKVLCDYFSPSGNYYDMMAGCGFSASIILKYGSLLEKSHLNDFDEECCDILKTNFPDSTVSNTDASHMRIKKAGLILIDFNSFTWKYILQWKNVLYHSSRNADNLWIVDTAVYSFKFGNNRYAYGCNNIEEYYEMMGDYFWDLFSMRLVAVSSFQNASLLCFVPAKGRKTPSPIKYIKGEPILIRKEKGMIF